MDRAAREAAMRIRQTMRRPDARRVSRTEAVR
jgi:hypothetical protein